MNVNPNVLAKTLNKAKRAKMGRKIPKILFLICMLNLKPFIFLELASKKELKIKSQKKKI